jgi:CBS domain containing-hemolysin-like protein
MALLIFYIFLALFVSFLCSVAESVLLSTPVSFLNVKLDEGKKSAGIMIKMKENIEGPLSAILSLNTIAHTVGAAGIGVQTAILFENLSFGIISAALTLLILIFSEIIPKTIGAMYWRNLALISGKVIKVMIIITWPFVIMAGFITRIFSRSKEEASVNRDELSAMARIGHEEGVFSEKESMIITNLIRLKTVRVTDIMTPRVVVTIADENMTISEFLRQKEYLHYSRIPVYDESRDNITGFVLRQEVFEYIDDNPGVKKLKDVKRNMVIVPESKTVLDLWNTMLNSKTHIALVVDEYGGMDGIVTMEDIFETLLGLEIVDERDKVVDMQVLARERWKAKKLKYSIIDRDS